MSELNKVIITKVIQIDENINIKYIIFVIINIFILKINNFNIKLVIQ